MDLNKLARISDSVQSDRIPKDKKKIVRVKDSKDSGYEFDCEAEFMDKVGFNGDWDQLAPNGAFRTTIIKIDKDVDLAYTTGDSDPTDAIRSREELEEWKEDLRKQDYSDEEIEKEFKDIKFTHFEKGDYAIGDGEFMEVDGPYSEEEMTDKFEEWKKDWELNNPDDDDEIEDSAKRRKPKGKKVADAKDVNEEQLIYDMEGDVMDALDDYPLIDVGVDDNVLYVGNGSDGTNSFAEFRYDADGTVKVEVKDVVDTKEARFYGMSRKEYKEAFDKMAADRDKIVKIVKEILRKGVKKSKVKDDSGEEQFDRGVKAGAQALEKGWNQEQTEKYYAELHEQFMQGVRKGFSKVQDSSKGLSEFSKDEFDKFLKENGRFEIKKDHYIIKPSKKEDFKGMQGVVFPDEEEKWEKVTKMFDFKGYGSKGKDKTPDFWCYGYADGGYGYFDDTYVEVLDKVGTTADTFKELQEYAG